MKKKVLFISLILLINLIFIDIVGAETYNNYTPATVSCGSNMLTKIPSMLPKVISILYTIIQKQSRVFLIYNSLKTYFFCIEKHKFSVVLHKKHWHFYPVLTKKRCLRLTLLTNQCGLIIMIHIRLTEKRYPCNGDNRNQNQKN